LSVGWVIDGLDSDDSWFKCAGVFVNVLEKVKLRRRRPHDKDLVRILERMDDIVEELAFFLRVVAVARLRFRMASDVVWRVKGRLVEGFRLDVKDPRLLVVNSNGSVTAHAKRYSTNLAGAFTLIFSWPPSRRCRPHRHSHLHRGERSDLVGQLLGDGGRSLPQRSISADRRE